MEFKGFDVLFISVPFEDFNTCVSDIMRSYKKKRHADRLLLN